MIINEKILKKYIPSLNVDNIENFKLFINNHIIESSVYFHFLNKNDNLIKIGKIIEFHKINYSNNDKDFYLVKIDIKTHKIFVVSSSLNIQKDRKIIVALNGTYLFYNEKKIFVESKKIGDIESSGIICSAFHLGLNLNYLKNDEKKDILFLEDDAAIGECALEYLGVKGFFLDLSITPDRNDLLSYIGFSKDLNSVLRSKKNKTNLRLEFNIVEKEEINPFQVQILTSNCFEYNIRYLTDIQIDVSPLWLRNYLLQHNILPINNVIDIINLIMLEYGIPLDVFDVSLLNDNCIQIRNAKKKEYFFCNQDNKKYLLDSNDLVITNKNDIISLSGIKTNHLYDISAKTQKMILCSFYFQSENISKTSQKIGVKNEKSLRLSRGIEQDLIKKVLDKAVFLLQKVTKCSVYKNICSIQKNKYINPEIILSLDFIRTKTGVNFSFQEVYNFLNYFNYKIETISFENFKVQAPLNRYHVRIIEDVISDLIRMYGYNRMLLDNVSISNVAKKGIKNFKNQNIYRLRKLLSNLGLNEIISYSLVSSETFNLFPNYSNHLKILKPLSFDKIYLRQNLSCSLLEILSFNQKNKNFDNAFFEIGNIYTSKNENKDEKLHLSIILSGIFLKTYWFKKDIKSSFFLLKGILERIQFFFDIKLDLKKNIFCDNFLPMNQAEIFFQDQKIGFIGETHPFLNKKYHIQKSFVLEINLEYIINNTKKSVIFKEITKFPSIIRDFSFFVNKKYSFQELYQTLKDKISGFFVECELLDLFQDDCVSSEEYSLTFRLTFNDQNKNLNKKQVNIFMEQIELEMKKKYKIKMR